MPVFDANLILVLEMNPIHGRNSISRLTTLGNYHDLNDFKTTIDLNNYIARAVELLGCSNLIVWKVDWSPNWLQLFDSNHGPSRSSWCGSLSL